MNLKVDHELIPVSEVIYDGIQEQGIDMDYILPDYYPEVFKILRCEASPRITHYNLVDGKLTYELCVDVTVLYCSEGSKQLNSLKQKLTYSRSLDLGTNKNEAEITLVPKSDYSNCRAINQRRIDVKGVVTIRVKVISEKNSEVICDASGMNIQMKKQHVDYTVGKLLAEKNMSIDEAVELSAAKSSVISVVRTSCISDVPDVRVIANKVIAKGNCTVTVLYSCQDTGVPSMEIMNFSVPYSQIVDMNGVDETYHCFTDVCVTDCDVTPGSDKDGKTRKLDCKIGLRVSCCAVKSAHTELVTDVYSTKYPCESGFSQFRINKLPVNISESFSTKSVIEYNEGTVEKVYDIWCTVGNTAEKPEGSSDGINISGMLMISALIRNSEGNPVLIEKETAFDHTIPGEESDKLNIYIKPCGCSYSISSDNKIEVTADLIICGKKYGTSEISGVSEIKILGDTVKSRDGNYSVKLYFCSEGENIWDIAKKYSTSVEEVMRENNLYDEKVNENCMLLIPIVN